MIKSGKRYLFCGENEKKSIKDSILLYANRSFLLRGNVEWEEMNCHILRVCYGAKWYTAYHLCPYILKRSRDFYFI